VELAVRGVASEDSDASWGAVDFTELTRTAKRQAAMFESSTEGREVIAQEALARAWEKRHSYQPARGPVEAWLFGLVRNVARERYRDSRRRHDLWHRLTGVLPSGSDMRSDVLDALMELPSEEQQLLYLRFWEDLSHREIAERIRVTEAASRQRLRRAIVQLGRRLR